MRPPSILIFASILTASGAAVACPTYPVLVQADLGLTYTPPCTICHTTAVGNATSATQPMALELIMLGANLSCDATVLANALKTMETDMTSVDTTGTPATTLLEDGCDPNTDAQIAMVDGGTCGAAGAPTPAYGCGAQIAGGPAPWQGTAAIAAIAALALARRRAARR